MQGMAAKLAQPQFRALAQYCHSLPVRHNSRQPASPHSRTTQLLARGECEGVREECEKGAAPPTNPRSICPSSGAPSYPPQSAMDSSLRRSMLLFVLCPAACVSTIRDHRALVHLRRAAANHHLPRLFSCRALHLPGEPKWRLEKMTHTYVLPAVHNQWNGWLPPWTMKGFPFSFTKYSLYGNRHRHAC